MGKASRRRVELSSREEDQRGSFDSLFPAPSAAVSATAKELMLKLDSIPAVVLTVPEVCELFNISRSTLHRANLPGKGLIGGSVRYDKTQLLLWWVDQQKKS